MSKLWVINVLQSYHRVAVWKVSVSFKGYRRTALGQEVYGKGGGLSLATPGRHKGTPPEGLEPPRAHRPPAVPPPLLFGSKYELKFARQVAI